MAPSTKSALQWMCTPAFDFNKPTLILLHASWMSSTMFEDTVADLSSLLPNVNLLRIDLNGHGKTIAGRQNFTLWDQAHDVIALMDELKIERSVFAGISMGSGIALRIALCYKSRVDALILISNIANEESEESRAAITQVRDIWVSSPSPSEDIMNAAMRAWGGDPDVHGAKAQRIKREWVERHSGAAHIDPVLRSVVQRDDISGRLAEITVPVLIVHGRLDASWALEHGVSIQKALVNAKVTMRIVEDSGHLVVWMRESGDVSGMMADFVESEGVFNRS